MIPSFISLLVLLSVVTAREQLDISSCLVDGTEAPMVCYFPGDCGNDRFSTQLLLAQFLSDTQKKECSAVVSLKRFTDRKWLVSMQMISPGNKNLKEIQIRYGQNDLLFGCKSENNGVVTIEAGSLAKDAYKTAVSGRWMLCKFTVEGSLITMLENNLPFKLILSEYTKNYDEQATNILVRVNTQPECDGSLLKFHKEPLAEDKTSLRPLVEYDTVRCEPGATLMAVQGGKPVEANVVCAARSYQVTARQPTSPPLDLTSKFACSVKTCTRCEDVTALGGGTKPNFLPAAGDACATLTCPGDRIQVPGTKPTVAKPACKEFGMGDFRWTIAHGGSSIPFTEAACQASVKCHDVTPLNVIVGDTASKINPEHAKIACSSDYQLAARASPTSPWSPIDSVKCNDKTGVWTKVLPASQEEKLLPTEEIKCMNEEEATAAFSGGKGGGTTGNSTKAPAPSEGNMVGIGIAIAFIAIAVILLIIFFAYYTIRRRRAEKSSDAVGEVDAKPPTPPASTDARASDKQLGTESTKMNVKEIPTAKQLEDNVSITAHPMPPTGPPSNGPSDKYGPSDKSTPTAPPTDVETSKKKVEALLDQSVPSMSE